MSEAILVLIKKNIKAGMVIPKPNARHDFIVKGFSTSKGEEALVYFIHNNNSNKFSEKRVKFSGFNKCYEQLCKTGELTRRWYAETFPLTNYQDPCNFTTIGGIFEFLSLAYYKKIGIYAKK